MCTTNDRFRLALLLAWGVSARHVAAAEPGLALERFVPAEAGSAWLQADSIHFANPKLRPHVPEDPFDTLVVRLGGSYAVDPLLVKTSSGGLVTKVVEAQATTTLGLSMTFVEAFRVGVVVPWQVHAAGARAIDGAAVYAAPASAVAPGDVRVALHGTPVAGERFRLALGGQVHLPTGDRASYAGEGVTRLEPQILAAGDGRAWVWAAQVGYPVRVGGPSTFGDVPLRESVNGVFAFGWRSADGEWLVGPELRAQVSLNSSLQGGRASGLLPMLGAHYLFAEGFRLHAGVGAGVGNAIGTPLWNASFALEWAPFGEPEEPPPPPPAPPPPPPPADTDGDGIVDTDDACPADAGVASAARVLHGCPEKVTVAVKFKVSSDVFLEASLPELERLRAELARFPGPVRFRVEGHTDTSGDARENLELSQMRAGAVVRWLVAHDLDLARFDAVGMGATKPRVANDTPENRAQNRRVEVHMIAPSVTP